MDHYAPDPLDWRASPLLADSLAGVAPAVVITAEYDPLRDQGVAYAERLRAEGVPVEHANYDGMVHAFFQLGPLVDAAAQAVSQIAAAAKAAFNPAARASTPMRTQMGGSRLRRYPKSMVLRMPVARRTASV